MEYFTHFHNWWTGADKLKTQIKTQENALRIGVLGAANISYTSIIDPIQSHPGAILAGIAARDLSKAQAQIKRFKLACKAYGSYDELLADPSVQAVYIPLPNGLHAEWSIKALRAGKHVLIEKPLTSNESEALDIKKTAGETNKVALEAFHWRFHPAAHHIKALIASGKYGHPTAINVKMALPSGLIAKDDIRFKYDKLGGGAAMDLTYIFSSSTYFATASAANPADYTFNVASATPRIHPNDLKIDEAMKATFTVSQPEKPDVHVNVYGDLSIPPLYGIIPDLWNFGMNIAITLEKATIAFTNFPTPHHGHSITITEKDTGKKTVEKVYSGGPQWGEGKGADWWTTYRWQLEAFVNAVRAKESGKVYDGPNMTLDESVKLMSLIDAVYEKAGLPKRGL